MRVSGTKAKAILIVGLTSGASYAALESFNPDHRELAKLRACSEATNDQQIYQERTGEDRGVIINNCSGKIVSLVLGTGNNPPTDQQKLEGRKEINQNLSREVIVRHGEHALFAGLAGAFAFVTILSTQRSVRPIE